MSEYETEESKSEFEELKVRARKEYDGMALKALVGHMHRGKQEKERLEKLLRATNAFYDVLRFEKVPERMELDGVENIRYDGIGRVSTTADLYVQVPAHLAKDFHTWLRSKKLGDLIKPTINPSTLKAFIKRRIQDGKEYPSDLVKVTPITRASITKG